jgi:hypothetical protein
MGRLGDVGFDAFEFDGFHGGALALDFFFEPLDEFVLGDEDAVQLLDLMFEVREVGFQLVEASGSLIVHAVVVPVFFQT